MKKKAFIKYKQITEEKGRVYLTNFDVDNLPASLLNEGIIIELDENDEPQCKYDEIVTTFINPKTKEITYEIEKRQLFNNEKKYKKLEEQVSSMSDLLEEIVLGKEERGVMNE